MSEQNLYPNDLKNREFSDAECSRFESEKTDSLLDIGAVFSGSKMGRSAQEKTDSSGRLGIYPNNKEESGFSDTERSRFNHLSIEGEFPLPKRIGRYVIDGVYAQGGMSVLFLATDSISNEHLLVKVLLPRFLSDQAIVHQFINEGRIIAMSDHPNIVKLYEYGLWEGGVFIAMELVQGTSLRKVIQYAPLPLKRALEVLIQICYAVSHLHGHGIFHGDLKPENILVTDQGQVKIIDFGIAKILSEPKSGIQKFVGTPIYMSPETRNDPKKISFQSDIYSLGVIAYELIMGKITHGRIILTLAPRGLQPILAKALQPQPKDRYSDVNELIVDLSEYIHSGACQKDKHGSDYFFELFEHMEYEQKNLLSSFIPKENPHLGATASYGVGLNALYFRTCAEEEETILLIAEGARKHIQGVIDTFRLHTLFEELKKTLSGESLILSLFKEAARQNISFRYSALILNHTKKSFHWIYDGWGKLFYAKKEKDSYQIIKIQENSLQKTFSSEDHFVLVGCESPSLLEFSSSPLTPIDIILTEAIQSTCFLSPEKQSLNILQKIRLRGSCIVDDHPVCLLVSCV